jgi:hypothetical protein
MAASSGWIHWFGKQKSRAQGRGSRSNARDVIALAPFGRCGDGVG